ncbi:AI-2E family transporter [Chryseolinea sp. T2]|uniref:AI-2E family transporter n=1 Tax=Chryseolinea sp. T2 TaxID=3129255 RepID=UPI0030789D20
MDKTADNSPFYLKFGVSLLAIGLLAAGVVLGRDIIIPILFAILLATLLLPIVKFLKSKGLHKVLSILIPVVLTFVTFVAILYFLSTQIMHFLDDAPALKERFVTLGHSFQKWVNEHMNIAVSKQNEYIEDTVAGIKEKSPQVVGKTLGSLTGSLAYVVLLPIYTFLILYYRETIKYFIVGVFKNGTEEEVRDVLLQSSTIAQKYVTGLMIETTIVFTLNTIGFLILGIKYVVFLALLAALLNLIPYVGMLVANIFCMVITLVSSEEPKLVLWVGVVLAVVQIIDNNFTMPWIVGNKVRINALVTIVGVLVGGALCGIPGMFLAIPGLAVLKVIFDKVPQLRPWGVLLGDQLPGESDENNTDEKSTTKRPLRIRRQKAKSPTFE